jgi:hypothetical protein
MNIQHPKSRTQFPRRSKQWAPNVPRPVSQDAQRNYERYLALAQAEIQAGDRIAAENYYQHAEHYFRVMASNRETK